MAEPLEDVRHPGTTVEPRQPDRELEHKNLMWGLALFGITVLLAAGTVVVALIYVAVADY